MPAARRASQRHACNTLASAAYHDSMATMESLELFFRFGAISLFAWQIAVIARDARHVAVAQFYWLMAAGLIGFLATHASVDLNLPAAAYYPLSFLSKSSALFIWWFVFAIFDDDFRLRRMELGFAALWIALIPFDYEPISRLAPNLADFSTGLRVLLSIALAVFILGRLFADYANDLVEARRRARLWLPAVIVALFIIDLACDYLTGYGAPPLNYSVFQKAVIFGFAFAIGTITLRLRAVDLELPAEPERPTTQAQTSSDPVLLERLQAAMDEKVFLDPELSLTGLAKQLAVTEARLRAVINADLEYRNFRTFLNQHRVEAAKKALSDPMRKQDPIIAIALDCGFNALPSFNRVFKDLTGQTPSAFRALKGTNFTS